MLARSAVVARHARDAKHMADHLRQHGVDLAEITGPVAFTDGHTLQAADGRPEGFCKLIADRADHTILGGHVLGEYSAENIQVIATAMTAKLTARRSPKFPSRSSPSPKPSA